jgi:hypothetical protein
MNITTFREKVLELNLCPAEKKRIQNLTSSYFKFLRSKTEFKNTEVDEKNYKAVWYRLNTLLAQDDKFHRKQKHMMRTSKRNFADYSHLAYNNSADDF